MTNILFQLVFNPCLFKNRFSSGQLPDECWNKFDAGVACVGYDGDLLTLPS